MNIYIYLIAINIIAFVLYGIDKYRARMDKWRIPEKTLLGIAAVGGALGALFGMFFWHHKTKKEHFRIIVPLCLLAWGGWIIFFMN